MWKQRQMPKRKGYLGKEKKRKKKIERYTKRKKQMETKMHEKEQNKCGWKETKKKARKCVTQKEDKTNENRKMQEPKKETQG